jgi:hypothetical protein
VAQGEGAKALQEYRELERRLEAERGLAPSEEIRALLASLATTTDHRSPTEGVRPAAGPSASPRRQTASGVTEPASDDAGTAVGGRRPAAKRRCPGEWSRFCWRMRRARTTRRMAAGTSQPRRVCAGRPGATGATNCRQPALKWRSPSPAPGMLSSAPWPPVASRLNIFYEPREAPPRRSLGHRAIPCQSDSQTGSRSVR